MTAGYARSVVDDAASDVVDAASTEVGLALL
jgi:hypothetical protein